MDPAYVYNAENFFKLNNIDRPQMELAMIENLAEIVLKTEKQPVSTARKRTVRTDEEKFDTPVKKLKDK